MLTNKEFIEYYERNARESITKEEYNFWMKGADYLAGRRKPTPLSSEHKLCYTHIKRLLNKGYNQKQVANLIGEHEAQINRIVRGHKISQPAYDNILNYFEYEPA